MLTIIVRAAVQSAILENITPALLELVNSTKKEEGCVRYELHQDNEQKNRFVFVETWQNRELWQKHMNGEVLNKFNQAFSDVVIELEIQEMKQIA